MPTSHTFVDDVFISYRHLDNESLDAEKNGWVDYFHKQLDSFLGEALGYEPLIWRDPRLAGNSDFSDVLKERLRKTAVLISILSPGYLQSEWCVGELKEFCRTAEQTGGLFVGDKMRIFKVVKTHDERYPHPPEFGKQLGYEFFTVDEMTKRPVAFGWGAGRDWDKRYFSKLDELALDITQVLSVINSRARIASGVSVFSQSQGAIYLAHTTRDVSAQRDQIKRELQSRNYEILPDEELPSFSPDYEEAVSECIGRAKLSVHLIGGNYGAIPEGAGGRSIVRLQNEVAARRSRDAAFSRLLWLPVGLTPNDPEQAQFIEHLKKDSEMQRGAELLQTPLEELKSVIQKHLSGEGHKTEPEPDEETPPKIYLICDRRDVEDVLPLVNYLSAEKNFHVLIPPIDKGEEDVNAVKSHNDNLVQCDAVLVYYGNANSDWCNNKLLDLKKLVGLGRKSPLAAKAVYVASPKDPYKLLFNNPEALVIKNFETFAPTTLDTFLARLRAAEKGAGDARA